VPASQLPLQKMVTECEMHAITIGDEYNVDMGEQTLNVAVIMQDYFLDNMLASGTSSSLSL
jgi:hypothetical protein